MGRGGEVPGRGRLRPSAAISRPAVATNANVSQNVIAATTLMLEIKLQEHRCLGTKDNVNVITISY